MHKKRLIPVGSLALALSLPAAAQTAATPSPSDLDALRKEIGAMGADYEARIQSREKGGKNAEAAAAKAQWSAPPAAAASGHPCRSSGRRLPLPEGCSLQNFAQPLKRR